MGKQSRRRRATKSAKPEVEQSESESESEGEDTDLSKEILDAEAMLAALDGEDEAEAAEKAKSAQKAKAEAAAKRLEELETEWSEREDALPVQHAPDDTDDLLTFDAIDEELVDAWRMAREQPEAYAAPRADVIESIRKNHNVRVWDGKVPFWTKVVYAQSDRLYCTIENKTPIFSLGAKVSFRVCRVFVAVTDREMATDVLAMRIDCGEEAMPSDAQRRARHAGGYLNANWSTFPDPFGQDASCPESAMYIAVDKERLKAHFREVHPAALKEMGLEIDDFDVCHMASKKEIGESWRASESARAAIFDGMNDDDAIELIWSSPVNLSMQTRLWVLANDA